MSGHRLLAAAILANGLAACSEGELAFRPLEAPVGAQSVAWGITRGASFEVSVQTIDGAVEVDARSPVILSLRFFEQSLEELGVSAGPLTPRSTEPVFGRLPAGLGDVVRAIGPGEDSGWTPIERSEVLDDFASADLPTDPFDCMDLGVEALLPIPAGGLVTGVASESETSAILLVSRDGRTELHRLALQGEDWTSTQLEPTGFDPISSSSIAVAGLEGGGVWLSSCEPRVGPTQTATVWSLEGDRLEPIMNIRIPSCPTKLLPPTAVHSELLLVNGFAHHVTWAAETPQGWQRTHSATISGDRVLRGEGDTLLSVREDQPVVFRLEDHEREFREEIEAEPSDRLRGLMSSTWGPLLLTGEGGVFANARVYVRRGQDDWEPLFSIYTQYWISALPFRAGALLTAYSGLIRQISLRDGYCVPDEAFSSGVWRGSHLAALDRFHVVVAGEAIADHAKHVVAVIGARSR